MHSKIARAFFLLLVIGVSVLLMILPAFHSKELSRIPLSQEIELELLLDTKQKIELVFFGYAGCADVCSPRLSDLGSWYDTLSQKTRENLGLKFLDLSVPEQKELPQRFAEAFHKDFTGLYLQQKELRRYSKAFNVYFSSSLTTEGEFNHSAHLYLIKRDEQGKKLRFIYTAYPYDLQQIHSDIEELLHE